jgi:cytochrome c peroxidase
MHELSKPWLSRKLLLSGLVAGSSLLTLAAYQGTAHAGEDDFTTPTTVPAKAPPASNTDTVETILKNLPESTPDYFKKVFPHLMSQPLPAKIFDQGGIPAVIPKLEIDTDPSGETGSYQPKGQTVTSQNAFFQSLGTNGRSCVTCHQPASGMSISLRNIQKRLQKTKGSDPLFAPVDGANCPTLVPVAETSGSIVGGYKGKDKKDFIAARSLLLNKGLIRVALPVPDNAQFQISVESDPTTCNIDERTSQIKVGDKTTRIVSMFRRPIMSGNLHFKTTFATIPGFPVPPNSGNIMWDGREPSLESQAIDATMGHAQAKTRPTEKQVAEMVAFEIGMFNAQYSDKEAGVLSALNATGGPVALSDHGNDPANLPAPGAASFDEFTAWTAAPGSGSAKRERDSIARGQALFNGSAKDAQGNPRGTFTLSGVAGFNDVIGVPALPGATCATCHNSTHSGADVLPNSQRDVGIGGQASAVGGPQPKPDLPIFVVSGCPTGSFLWDAKATSTRTNDLGRAMITGQCRDVGASTVPSLRALSSHEPYFRDGSAATLKDVVEVYNNRFNIGLTAQEKEDLSNFLSAL